MNFSGSDIEDLWQSGDRKSTFFALKYMRQVMPVDHMFFQFYDEEHNAMHILADASPECGRIVDLQVKLSVGARQELMQFREEFRHKKSKFVWLFRDNPRKQKLTDEIFNSLGYSTTSLMVFPLGLKFQELLGAAHLFFPLKVKASLVNNMSSYSHWSENPLQLLCPMPSNTEVNLNSMTGIFLGDYYTNLRKPGN